MKRIRKVVSFVLVYAMVSVMFFALPIVAKAEDTAEEFFNFESGTGTITAYTGAGGAVTIPSTIGGVTVEHIGDFAFSMKGLTSVIIPDTVTSIGDNAFQFCGYLDSITIPDSVKTIGMAAFSYCETLTDITIPSSVTSIGAIAFNACCDLVSINVDSGNNIYASIDGVLFDKSEHELLWYPAAKPGTSYAIPASVIRIGNSAFSSNRYLTNMSIASTITDIADYPFSWSKALTSISVSSENPNYKTIDGVLFSKDGSRLIQYPAKKAGTDFTVPNTVTNIVDGAFAGCSSLVNVTIPEGVTAVNDDAFNDCPHLASIKFPRSVENIGAYSFVNCGALSKATILNADAYIEEAALHCTIYGGPGSTAQTYAEENHILFIALEPTMKQKVVAGKLQRTYYRWDETLDYIKVYYGSTASSGVYKVTYYEDGKRIAYKFYNNAGKLTSYVACYADGSPHKNNYYDTETGKRYACKMYDTAGRTTHYIYMYGDGVKPKKMSYYDVSTGKRYAYKLYDTAGRTTHYTFTYDDGVKPEKTNYYDVSTGIRRYYKLYDTAGRTTYFAECYPDGVKAKKMNYYNPATGVRTAYKTYRSDGSCSCYVQCNSSGQPYKATYYDKDGDVIKVVYY